MTSQTFWEFNGEILVDPITNKPIFCEDCPCDGATPRCHPCTNYSGDTVISDTAKRNLTIEYSGFSSGVCDPTYSTGPELFGNDWRHQYTGCTDSCELMNQPFTLLANTGGSWNPCTWRGNHNICATNTTPTGTPLYNTDYYWGNSVLEFKQINFGTPYVGFYWAATLRLNGYDWVFEWTKSIGNAWENTLPQYENCLGDAYLTSDGYTPGYADCGEIGNNDCATFTASDQTFALWLPGHQTINIEDDYVPIYNFVGLSCPCDIGWGGPVSEGATEWVVKTTALPGSGLTATITGW